MLRGGSEDVVAEGAASAVGGPGWVVEEGSEVFEAALRWIVSM